MKVIELKDIGKIYGKSRVLERVSFSVEKGHIVECGTHDELISRSEIYREIYEQQTNGGEDHA